MALKAEPKLPNMFIAPDTAPELLPPMSIQNDQLGLLLLSVDDLRRRDEIVIGDCADMGIPVAAALAGGYAPDVQDTVQIHYGTACSLAEHCK